LYSVALLSAYMFRPLLNLGHHQVVTFFIDETMQYTCIISYKIKSLFYSEISTFQLFSTYLFITCKEAVMGG